MTTTQMSGADAALAFAGDEGFARGLATVVHSTLWHLSPEFRPQVFVLDNGLSEASAVRLRRLVDRLGRGAELRWVHTSEPLDDLPEHSRLGLAAYARLLLPELLPGTVGRALYLDADVLVRRDLQPLFSVDLGAALVGAVRDSHVRSTAHLHTGAGDPAGGTKEPYFNTGVLLMDVAGWRETRLADRVLRYVSAHREALPFGDQDALNVVVDRFRELDHAWNVQVWSLDLAKRRMVTDIRGYRQDRRLYRTAAVRHFIGPKPWDWRCETRGTMSWVRAFLRTGWYTRGEACVWLARWLSKRVMYWPGVVSRRWTARIRSVEQSVLARRR